MLDDLRALSRDFLEIKNEPYRRYLIETTRFSSRLSLLMGPRGVGKTTTLVQKLLEHAKGNRLDKRILYVQADHFAMGSWSLYEIAEQFQLEGGELLALDEIHKYAEWSMELKSIYDTFPKLKVIGSGSSALAIQKGSHDLSRRAIVYHMQGLSFREYLELTQNIELPVFTVEEIANSHPKLCGEVLDRLKQSSENILPLFQHYLKLGYFPYFQEFEEDALYRVTLEQNLHTTIESDLTAIFPQLGGASVQKMKALLKFIAGAVPFVPNWARLKTLLEIGDERTLKVYVKHLEDAGLLRTLVKASAKLSRLETPSKIYLDNPNQLDAISSSAYEKGTLRETFFLNMLAQQHQVTLPDNGDFLVDKTYLFEVGGKKKGFQQIQGMENSFVASDDIEYGAGNRIPLWLFGFVY